MPNVNRHNVIIIYYLLLLRHCCHCSRVGIVASPKPNKPNHTQQTNDRTTKPALNSQMAISSTTWSSHWHQVAGCTCQLRSRFYAHAKKVFGKKRIRICIDLHCFANISTEYFLPPQHCLQRSSMGKRIIIRIQCRQQLSSSLLFSCSLIVLLLIELQMSHLK